MKDNFYGYCLYVEIIDRLSDFSYERMDRDVCQSMLAQFIVLSVKSVHSAIRLKVIANL